MKIFNIFILFFISFIISGCLNYEQITTLKIDGSGDMYIHYWTKISSHERNELFEQVELFSENFLKNEFSSKYTIINDLEIYKDFRDSTIHSKIKFSFSNIDSLNDLSIFNRSEISLTKINDGEMLFSQNIIPSASGYGFPNDSSVMSYIFYIPGEILEHNADKISNNKVTWTLNSDNINLKKKLFARFEPYKLKETPLWVYLLALVMLFVVVYYLFKIKRP